MAKQKAVDDFTKKLRQEEEIEQELGQILGLLQSYRRHGQIEELTYLLGAVMATLENMGCPIYDLRLRVEEIVDRWANSKNAPARS